jgi:hypothetical protein
METLHYLIPTVVACLLVVRRELVPSGVTSSARFFAHLRRFGFFALGLLLPIGLYLLSVGLSDVPEMLSSLRYSISRQLAVHKAGRYLPPLAFFWPALPYMALLGLGSYVPAAARLRRRALLVAAGVLALVPIVMSSSWYPTVWLSARSLAPAVVLVGGALLWRTARHHDVPRHAELCAFLLLALAALVSLVQYPFSGAIYFCYVAPLVALAAAALVNAWSRPLAILHAGVGLFYLVFALLRMNSGYLDTLGEREATYRADARLTMPRGRLRVPRSEADTYNALVEAIREKSRGDDLWVGPDCPELYFLADRRNPDRWFYGFQDPLYRDDAALLRRLESPRFRVIVIQNHPSFSARYTPALLGELARRFPSSAEFGDFTLRWKDGADPPAAPPL